VSAAPAEPASSSSSADQSRRLDLRTRLIIWLGVWLIVALKSTLRIRVIGREGLLARREGEGRVVYAFWHGQILPCMMAHSPARCGVLISEHRDGEIIARIIERFEMYGIRGSTSRGGTRALLECVRTLRGGDDVAVTPDGPRGPRHSFAPGALLIGFRSGAPVVTISAHLDRAWRLNSWDQFEIPKPFARLTVYYGEPRHVHAEDVRAVSDLAGDFGRLLEGDNERANALARTG
jgi:lysophospholipid acyltransferase (LPLAT)-like uncharacterized protein